MAVWLLLSFVIAALWARKGSGPTRLEIARSFASEVGGQADLDLVRWTRSGVRHDLRLQNDKVILRAHAGCELEEAVIQDGWRVSRRSGRSFFTPALRRNMDELVRLGGVSGARLQTRGQSVIVSKPCGLDQSGVRALVRLSEPLIRRALEVFGVEGVEIIGMSTRAGVCQVCGCELSGRTVVCGSCRTPHHADCWAYLRRCSTYACRGQVDRHKSGERAA